MNGLRQLIHEVRRRSLWQVLGIYVAGSAAVLGGAGTLADALRLPDWFVPLALGLLIVGLPIVLATAFVQEGGPSRSPTGERAPQSQPRGPSRFFNWRNALLGGLTGLALWGLLATGVMIGSSGMAVRELGTAGRNGASSHATRFRLPTTDDTWITRPNNGRALAISRDGTKVVFMGPESARNGRLFIHYLDRLESTPIQGTERSWHAFFSPGGEWVGFMPNEQGEWPVLKVPVGGGPVITVAPPGHYRGADWGDDDRIVLGSNPGGLMRVPGDGGQVEVLTTPDESAGEVGHVSPSIIGGWDAILFVILVQGEPNSIGGPLAVLDLRTMEVSRLGLEGFAPHYVSTGHLLYADTSGTLLAVPFDAESLEVVGTPTPVVSDVRVKNYGVADYDISDAGTLVYVPAGDLSGNRALAFVSRSGDVTPLDTQPFDRGRGIEVSPDGRRVALGVADPGQNIWVQELPNGAFTRLTVEERWAYYPHWSPDSRSITYGALPPGGSYVQGDTARLYTRRADGTGEPRLLTEGEITSEANFVEGVWSPDGRSVVLRRLGALVGLPSSAMDLYMLRPGVERVPSPLIASDDFAEQNPAISRDGRWLAYNSDESGHPEIFVRPFPNVDDGRIQVSTNGGSHPVWAHNGHELFYYEPATGQLEAVEYTVAEDGSFRREAVTTLFDVPSGVTSPTQFYSFYDVMPNDEQFLMAVPSEVGTKAVVVLDWFDELRGLVPS